MRCVRCEACTPFLLCVIEHYCLFWGKKGFYTFYTFYKAIKQAFKYVEYTLQSLYIFLQKDYQL